MAFEKGYCDDLLKLNSDTVENYLENRSIYDELNHYKEKGTILGKHKIFDRLKRTESIRDMKLSELFQLKLQLENNLVRNKKKLRDDPNHPQTKARRDRCDQMKMELKEIMKILNL